MKKTAILASMAIVFFAACNKTSTDEQNGDMPEQTVSSTVTHARCGTQEKYLQLLREDPTLQQRMEAQEAYTQNFLSQKGQKASASNDVCVVDVVFNILYNTEAANVTDNQLLDQLLALTYDYTGQNGDVNKTNAFQSVKSGDTRIRFRVAKIVRKKTTITAFDENTNQMKSAAKGGIDPTDPGTKLNIWICTLKTGTLGYTYLPGTTTPANDGIVIQRKAFGIGSPAVAPYNKGRTLTHEMGHFFNLLHIWGDKSCGNDQVNDTPVANDANTGCPPANKKSTCSGNPIMMTMNFMDYTDDACMWMFTKGQSDRMWATWRIGGSRANWNRY